MKIEKQIRRRKFAKITMGLIGAGISFPYVNFGKPNRSKAPIVGHGDFQYKVHWDWGKQNPTRIPVKDCHEMVQDRKGRLFLLTNETKNNVIIYDRSGKVLSTWGNAFPGGHGLTLSREGEEEFLFITDHDRHQVFKTTLDGKILMTLDYPKETGKYEKAEQYKPTEVAVAPNGDFYVADGYGLDYIIHYNHKGKYIRHFGGKGDNKDQLKNAHGVCIDQRDPANPVLLVTSRATQEFKRFTLDGKYLDTVSTPGCWICRPVIHGDNLYFSVIVTKNWGAYDGLVIVLDKKNRIISAPGGSAPVYQNGLLQEIEYDGHTFLNPHDVCVDQDTNLYVPQWYSGKTYPVMLERI
ncbi:6-bladed beta-propeller [Rapidithrix thailandica]|uniref:6-bladed beta-propeller n=1 Tax=Rapidithrix thailandica TaxID=413964 RepID=A0AAW9S7V7_9BACT